MTIFWLIVPEAFPFNFIIEWRMGRRNFTLVRLENLRWRWKLSQKPIFRSTLIKNPWRSVQPTLEEVFNQRLKKCSTNEIGRLFLKNLNVFVSIFSTNSRMRTISKTDCQHFPLLVDAWATNCDTADDSPVNSEGFRFIIPVTTGCTFVNFLRWSCFPPSVNLSSNKIACGSVSQQYFLLF